MSPNRRRKRLTERQRTEPTPGTKVSTHGTNPKAVKKRKVGERWLARIDHGKAHAAS